MSRFAEIAAATLLVTLLTTACGKGKSQTIAVAGYPNVTRTELATSIASLCDVATQAATSPETARTTFYDRAHVALHVLAGATTAVDRPAAGSLLIAKQRVEADFAATRPPNASLAADVRTLIEAAAHAAGRVNVKAPPCA